MNKVYLSQKTAKTTLRQAGFTCDAAAAAVELLKKFEFGKREKVKAADVRRLINDAAHPTPMPPSPRPIRPVIPRHLRT